MLDGLRLSFGTLTAWPVRPPSRLDRGVAGRAMSLAPLTTVPMLALLFGWVWLARAAGLAPMVTAVVALALVTLGTRAMHLDGLADTADGLAASYDRDTALEVMRRGNIGPGGVAAITLVLLVDVACLTALLPSWRGCLLAVTALLSSRLTLAWACAAGVSPARPEGLGATVAGTVSRPVVALCTLVVAGGAVVLSGPPWWSGPAVVAGGVLSAVVVVRRSVTRLGGITGDVLGAVVEISLAVSLTVGALLAGSG